MVGEKFILIRNIYHKFMNKFLSKINSFSTNYEISFDEKEICKVDTCL